MATFLLIAALAVFVYYAVYINLYFRSADFLAIKNGVAQHTENCNDLNDHVEALKSAFVNASTSNYGYGLLSDSSLFKMKRAKWKDEVRNDRTYNCSASVCKNASNQPFKYLCKYFNIEPTEKSLAEFESVLNDFSAAEQGKELLQDERDAIVAKVRDAIPKDIYLFARNRVVRELGFEMIDLSDLYVPVYTFHYVSAGGNSASRVDIKLDVRNLDGFVTYMGDLVNFRASMAGQRALMTSALRERIKERDGYACRICRLSIADEKNLLLEIDHIVPLARGGVTTEANLQTLCWKCNRRKGTQIYEANGVSNALPWDPAQSARKTA